jgi:hypothetical protein
MANGDAKGIFNGHTRPIILAGYFVAAALSGIGGSYAWLNQVGPDIVRPDPYTGAQARGLESRINALEYHVRNHPDQTNQFDRRITVVETNQRVIIANQERILSKLEK